MQRQERRFLLRLSLGPGSPGRCHHGLCRLNGRQAHTEERGRTHPTGEQLA